MSDSAMTRPQQIAAMKARLAEVDRATAAFRAALPASNDTAHHDFFGEVLGRIAMILDNEQAGVTGELAGDLSKARQDLRRLPLPELDPNLDTSTPALHALRGERGNLVEALENALDAAESLGFEQRLPDFAALHVPRDSIREQLIRLDERLRGVQENLDGLRQAAAEADAPRPDEGVSQRELINLHVRSLKVELGAARFETRTGTGPEIPADADLAALARTTEAIRDIARDMKALVEGLRDWVAPAVRLMGGLVARAAERSWNGVRAVIRNARRRFAAAPAEPASTEPPPDFDLDEAHRMILDGQAPPESWWPFIDDLDFGQKKFLTDLRPLSELTGLQSLNLRGTSVMETSVLAGLTGLQLLRLSRTGVTEIGVLAGLTGLQWLDLSGTGVTEIGALEGLTGMQWLNLSETRVTEIGALAGLTGLQSLHLRGMGVTEIGALAGLTGLQWLDLSGTGVAEIGALEGLTRMQWVNLSGTGVTEIGALAGLTGLQSLDLSGTGVTETGALAGLTGLQSLDLSGTGVTEIGALAGLTGLRWLDLDDTGVTEIGALAGLMGLTVQWKGQEYRMMDSVPTVLRPKARAPAPVKRRPKRGAKAAKAPESH